MRKERGKNMFRTVLWKTANHKVCHMCHEKLSLPAVSQLCFWFRHSCILSRWACVFTYCVAL